jgi:hypothetical protein
VIFFSLRDQHQQRSEPPTAGEENYFGSEINTPSEAALRKIPQRRSPAPVSAFLRTGGYGDSTLATGLSPENEPADEESASVSPEENLFKAVPIGAVIGVQNTNGVVAGHVTLNGTPPPEIDVPLDPSCSRLRPDKLRTRFFVVDDRGGLADVVVALTPIQNGPPLTPPVLSQPVLLDQIGCEFVPYVLGLQVGQRLVVRNSDPVLHNVHVTPNMTGNLESNRAQPAGSPDLELTFDTPELFLRIKCDIHPWMFSYLGVFEHAYFAITQSDGSFQIIDVPPGDYMLAAAHRKLPKSVKPVMVHTSETSRVDFVLDFANAPLP